MAHANILFISANPADTRKLQIEEEKKQIEQHLIAGGRQDRFRLIIAEEPVTRENFLNFILKHRPTIIHFSGHGSSDGRLIFSDAEGKSDYVNADGLTNVFKTLSEQHNSVKCVILNCCYSADQAAAIAQFIPCVFGTPRGLSDNLAIQFAAKFYLSIGYGRSVYESFQLGIAQAKLKSNVIPPTNNLPQIVDEENALQLVIFDTEKPSITSIGSVPLLKRIKIADTIGAEGPGKYAIVLASFNVAEKTLRSKLTQGAPSMEVLRLFIDDLAAEETDTQKLKKALEEAKLLKIISDFEEVFRSK